MSESPNDFRNIVAFKDDDAVRKALGRAADALESQSTEGAILKADNKRLRKVAAHVPALDYMRAEEKAGFGRTVSGTQT